MQIGLEHHRAGRLVEAEGMYREVLAIEPSNADALHYLGTIAHQVGMQEFAIELIEKALSFKPDLAEAHCNLGNALKEQGKLDEAVASYGKALSLKPDYAEAHNNLGNALKKQGKLDEAVARYRRALSLSPDLAEAHNNLGNALQQQGNLDEAVASYRKALSFKPNYSEAYSNLGFTLQEQGELDEAVANCRKALSIKPDYAGAHNNLGNALKEQGKLDEAVASYLNALSFEPNYAEAHSNLGNALKEQGKLDAAVASYRRALSFKPNYAEVHSNLGNVLKEQGKLDDAVASCLMALSFEPNYGYAHNNLGNALQEQGKLNEAVACYLKALSLKPDFAEAHNNLGNALHQQGKLDEAEAAYRNALSFKRNYEDAFGNLLFVLNYHPDRSSEEVFAVYREYDERFGLPYRGKWRTHSNSRETCRRLKLGYVSPDFRRHSCRHFLEPLLAHHDKCVVEIYAYAELSVADEVTARYRKYIDHWVPTAGMSDDALAERIRADGIDILVDLAGHTAKNRLQAFARKPAPVSLSWLGFGYTTGLSAVDYLLTDMASAPAGTEGLFSEKPWRLETPGYAYRPAEGMGAVSALAAVERGYITFGTLTRAIRINHRTISVWSEILKRVDGARLVIDSPNFRSVPMQNALAQRFAVHGIGRERLAIGCHSPPWDVLRGIDIGLDCFPHNSGTTLFETLYLGVPFITLAGRPSVGRLGSSVLQGVRHPEWIARTEDEYIEKAVTLARDLPTLAAVRAGLRTQMETSPLMDEAGFARKVEAAFRQMFRDWAKT